MKISSLILPLLGILFLTISACKDSATNPGPVTPTDTVHFPKAGSIFVFDHIQYDSSSTSGPSTSHDTITATVLTSDTSFAGKASTNLFKLIETGIPGSSQYYYGFESNGDFMMYTVGDLSYDVFGTNWLIYPVGSKKDITMPTLDTTYVISGVTYHRVYQRTVKYVGTEDITVGSETIKTYKAVAEATMTMTVNGGKPTNAKVSMTVWISPKLGHFVRQYVDVNNYVYPRATADAKLVSYTLN